MLAERDLTDAERLAVADEPRLGVWVETSSRYLMAVGGDGRLLTQDETDSLIGLELTEPRGLAGIAFEELQRVVGRVRMLKLERFDTTDVNQWIARQQRGGLHSEPLVRLLAYRAWGERDRKWWKRDTARAIGDHLPHSERIQWDNFPSERLAAYSKAYQFDSFAVYEQPWNKCRAYEAMRGERTATVEVPYNRLEAEDRPADFLFSVVFDELDRHLSRPDIPHITNEPFTTRYKP